MNLLEERDGGRQGANTGNPNLVVFVFVDLLYFR